MEQIVRNREVVLVSYTNEGPVTDDHLKIRETQLNFNACKEGEVVVKNMWASVDPYLRWLMKEPNAAVYLESFKLDQVKMLKEEYGFDDAFNYKTETDWDATLSKYFPRGIDIYFENVGGKMLEAVLNHINMNARIPLCGMISQYNQDWKESYGVRNFFNLVGKCGKMQGFLVLQYFHRMEEFVKEVGGYMQQGKIKYKEDVTQGIENFLEAFNSLFIGGNAGKALIQLTAN